MTRPGVDQVEVAHASERREGEAPSPLLAFAGCALSGFVVGLLVNQGWAFAGLMAALLLAAGTAGWILRGMR